MDNLVSFSLDFQILLSFGTAYLIDLGTFILVILKPATFTALTKLPEDFYKKLKQNEENNDKCLKCDIIISIVNVVCNLIKFVNTVFRYKMRYSTTIKLF